jgi:hypothetical protein
MKIRKIMIRILAVLLFCGFLQPIVAQDEFHLIVEKAGEGSGVILSSPPGIECGEGDTKCSATFGAGTPVTLTPKETTGSVFEGWSATTGSTTHCEGTQGPCSFIISSDSMLTATFVISNQ